MTSYHKPGTTKTEVYPTLWLNWFNRLIESAAATPTKEKLEVLLHERNTYIHLELRVRQDPKAKLGLVTESARAHSYYFSKPVQKTAQFWLLIFGC